MKNDKFLENIFNQLSTIQNKLEDFIDCESVRLNEQDMLFLELIDKRSWEVSGIAGEIERRVQKKT